jgi:hypothetical protein
MLFRRTAFFRRFLVWPQPVSGIDMVDITVLALRYGNSC